MGLYFLILLSDTEFAPIVNVSGISNSYMLLEKEQGFGVFQINKSSKES